MHVNSKQHIHQKKRQIEKLTGVPYCQLQFLVADSEELDFKIHP